MMKVKICGITNHEDAQKAMYYGAYAAGFIFHKKSPRYVSPSKARKLIEGLPPFIVPVGVFVDLKEKAVRDICQFTRIRTVQFHGEETPLYCKRFADYKIIKAFRVNDMFDPVGVRKYKVDAYLFDTFQENVIGGTGKTFNWEVLKGHKFEKPVILSGGLTAENVAEAIGSVNPYAVDVSSGVEKSPGIKDPRKIREFMQAALVS
ncbi:MAG: phosphoribosylanthranilate isomerase [Candidatus Omnitrophica bacterium]|nr:phosphoribosylanthranilate isomerase [Candidatus Omnitrophota bacterium]MCB9721334.1 phosphoribosylanthranilate isomerase [Candidatus Omnitrophota bacterium]